MVQLYNEVDRVKNSTSSGEFAYRAMNVMSTTSRLDMGDMKDIAITAGGLYFVAILSSSLQEFFQKKESSGSSDRPLNESKED